MLPFYHNPLLPGLLHPFLIGIHPALRTVPEQRSQISLICDDIPDCAVIPLLNLHMGLFVREIIAFQLMIHISCGNPLFIQPPCDLRMADPLRRHMKDLTNHPRRIFINQKLMLILRVLPIPIRRKLPDKLPVPHPRIPGRPDFL